MPSSLEPSFFGLQVRDVEKAAEFYEHTVGLERAQVPSDRGAMFATGPIPFGLRKPLSGTDLDAGPLGLGATILFHSDEPQELHDRLVAAGVEIVTAPYDGPFGLTFAFRDLDGYKITIAG